jgi:hypothetical protein
MIVYGQWHPEQPPIRGSGPPLRNPSGAFEIVSQKPHKLPRKEKSFASRMFCRPRSSRIARGKPEDDKIDVAPLEHISFIEWDNVILYGSVRAGPRSGPLTSFLKGYFDSNLGGTLSCEKSSLRFATS